MKNPTETAEFFIHLKQPDKAKIVLDLLKPYAHSIDEIDQLGKLYSEIREFHDTLDLAFKVYNNVENEEMKFNARVNIIRAYLNLNKPEDALEYISLNDKIDPTDHANKMDRAFAYFLLNRKIEGEQILRNILTEPHSEDIDNRVKFNLGTYDLYNGKFKEGLHEVLLGGRKLHIWEKCDFPASQYWSGDIIPGKTILLCSEGGIGDEIISVRFMKHIKELGMNPMWNTSRKDIAKIFNRCGFPTIDIKYLPEDWLWTYSMPVPSFLNLCEDDLWYGPYLSPIKKQKSNNVVKKIGIKTTGNPKYDQDLHRSIPPNELIDCIPAEYEIYSFHIDENINHPRVISVKDKITSWDDTLNLIDEMDLIISSCTSLIHAAGAIGKKSVVIIPILSYYTWAYPGSTTKWYDNKLTILRQTEYNNWTSPLDELKAYFNDNEL